METIHDIDPEETREWLDSLDAVIDAAGVDRAHFLLEQLITTARLRGTYLPYNANTPYLNTIPADRQPHYPGDREIERRISSTILGTRVMWAPESRLMPRTSTSSWTAAATTSSGVRWRPV